MNIIIPTKENSKKPYFDIVKIEEFLQIKEHLKHTEFCRELYAVYFVHAGEVTYSAAHVRNTAEYNTLLFIPAHIKHRISIENKSNGLLILFNDSFYSNFSQTIPIEDYLVFHQDRLSSLIRLSENDFAEMLSIFKLLELERRNDSTRNPRSLHQLLSYFLSKSKEHFLAQTEREEICRSRKTNPIFTKFKKMLESRHTVDRNVSSYAKRLNIHPYCLNEICKLSTSLTASEMIRVRIISEAKKRILGTDKSFKEIAYELGFDDPAYFSRYFKKHTGGTPSHFQQNSCDMSK